MRIWRIGAAVTAALLAAAVLAACGSDEQGNGAEAGTGGGSTTSAAAAPAQRLTVAVPTVASDILIHLAKAEGYFAKDGVDVAITENTGANTSSIVVAGQADIAIFAAITPLVVASQGKPSSIVYGFAGGGLGGAVFGAPGKVRSMQQLASLDSCRIATFPPGTSAYGYAAFYKQKFRLKCDLAPLADPAAQLGAVAAGRADAIVGAYANWAQAVSDGKVLLIGDTRDPAQRRALIGQTFPEVTLWGLTDDLQQKKTGVEALLKGVDQAYRYVQSHSVDEVASVLKQFPAFGELSPSALRDTVAGQVPYLTLGSDKGYITEPQWDLGLQRYALWGVPGFDGGAPGNAYGERIDMSYYEAAIGRPR